MKYNLSTICRKANEFAKSMSLSDAFKKAWKIEKAVVRIEEIKDEIFDLNMADRLTTAASFHINRLYSEMASLRDSIKEAPEQPVIAQPTEQEDELLVAVWTAVVYDNTLEYVECDAYCEKLDARRSGRIPASEVQDIIDRYAA